MAILISVPILLLLLILQTTVAGEITLIHGTVDLILLWLAAWGLNSKDKSGYLLAVLAGGLVSYVSALPWYVYLFGYLSVIILARFVYRRLWQSPMLSMFAITLVSSIVLYLLTMIGLRINGTEYPLQISLISVIIPSIFLNLLMAIPIFVIVRDLSGWVYRSEELA